MRTRSQANGKLVIESVAFGVGYTAMLIWVGSALVASFAGTQAYPYWSAIPFCGPIPPATRRLRLPSSASWLAGTCSCGAAARRRPSQRLGPPDADGAGAGRNRSGSLHCRCHLSDLQRGHTSGNPGAPADYLLPRPSEGTARVIVLGICLVAVATSRYLRANAPRQSQPASVPESIGPFPSRLCFASLQYVNGLGELGKPYAGNCTYGLKGEWGNGPYAAPRP